MGGGRCHSKADWEETLRSHNQSHLGDQRLAEANVAPFCATRRSSLGRGQVLYSGKHIARESHENQGRLLIFYVHITS